MCQGVGDLYFRALSFVPMVFQYEVYHPWAGGLEVTVFVVQWWVYLASSLLCFVGVVVGALFDKDVRCPVLWGTFPVRHGLSRLCECRDGRGQWGLSDLGHHAGVCWDHRREQGSEDSVLQVSATEQAAERLIRGHHLLRTMVCLVAGF